MLDSHSVTLTFSKLTSNGFDAFPRRTPGENQGLVMVMLMSLMFLNATQDWVGH